MEVKTMKTIFKVVAIAGVPVTSFLAARGGKTKAERLLKGEKYETGKDKFVLNAKAYGPAVAAGAVTVTSIVLSDYFGGKELAAATALAAGVAARKDQIKQQFEKYRDVVKEEDGKERDVDILKKASEVEISGDGEVVHTYRIDWIDEPIYFESTAKDVGAGLSKINKGLLDLAYGLGLVTVSDALNFLGHPELRNHKTDIAGWELNLMNVVYDSYFVEFDDITAGESAWYKDEDPNVHVIVAHVEPEPDLQMALKEAQEIGII